jgi:CRP/FNR family transcriptional regulator, anaerobic regulatory protein
MNTGRSIDPSPPAPLWNDCPNCSFIAWCTPANLTAHQVRQFGDRLEHRRLRKHHEYLHRIGAALISLYVINSGFLRTSITDDEGREQIIGFLMPGDLVGMEAIATGRYQCDTITLEDSSVCGVAFADFQQLNRDIPALQHHFHRALGSEIARDHSMMMMLGVMCAEERVASFLLNLSQRFAARGCSATLFHLPMTRQDIGNYLGLKMETVSRAFSHLASSRLIAIHGKDVEIISVERLQQTIRNRE